MFAINLRSLLYSSNLDTLVWVEWLRTEFNVIVYTLVKKDKLIES